MENCGFLLVVELFTLPVNRIMMIDVVTTQVRSVRCTLADARVAKATAVHTITVAASTDIRHPRSSTDACVLLGRFLAARLQQ